MNNKNKNNNSASNYEEKSTHNAYYRNPQRRIRVFISSKLDNDGAFSNMRSELAREIEKTGVFTSYLWERGGAATTTAEMNYRMEVCDSDLCVFVLDHSTDVPLGVQNEIDEARIDGKKCLFYFVTENGRKELSLKSLLEGAKGQTYKDVDHFSDVPTQVVGDLQGGCA